jgi:hypothetical protein
MQGVKQAKHGSASLLYIGLGILLALLTYVSIQATHHTDRIAQPPPPIRDSK